MELAIKLYIAYALYVLQIVNITDSAKICKVPRGNAGTCIKITDCPPLMALDKKKHKTINEKNFIRQSICGYPDYDPIKGARKHLEALCEFILIRTSSAEEAGSLLNSALGLKYCRSFRLNQYTYLKQYFLGKMRAGSKGFLGIKVCCPSKSEWRNFQPNPIIVPSFPVYNLPGSNLQPNQSDKINPNEINNNESTPDDFNNTTCGQDWSSGNKITNGDVTAIDQYPWLALLEYKNSFLGCGGSLISKRYILTAAHCIKSKYGLPLFIRLAEYNTTSYPTDVVETDGGGSDSSTVTIIATKKFYVHPDYNRGVISDIGLIEMERPVEFDDFIKVICIPEKDYMPEFQPSTFFYVAGWGSDNINTGTEVKMDTTVTYKTHSQCPLLSEETATTPALKICAGGEGGRDTCRGDSGGPLMYENENHQYQAIGIVSYGPSVCGLEGNPAVYTYVYSYLEWIKSILNGRPNNNAKK